MGKQITDYLLYRWRYILGYGVIGLTIVAMLIVAGLLIPGGLSQAEIQSVVTSNAVTLSPSTFQPESVVNLPYHILQHVSMMLFGVTVLSVKLPSLLLGLLSVVGMFILLRIWFRENVAVLTAIIVITTGQFLFVAQSGTPGIVYIFWSVWLLVSATMISRGTRFMTLWKIALFGIAALSIYTPLSPYILIALASAIILHPHLRYIVRQLSKMKLLVGLFIALVLIAPLIYAVIHEPSVGLTLLGLPNMPNELGDNALQLLRQYFDFISPSSGIVMTPIYSLGSVILIILGVIQLATTKYTARSYIIAAWLILLVPALIINPNDVSVAFVPFMLLIAMGVHRLLTSWYRLFPRNPYARLAGLIPLVILIGGMVFSGINRYMYGYMYDPQTADNFSHDLRLLNQQLKSTSRGATTIVVTQDEVPFYNVVARYTANITIVTQVAGIPSTTHTALLTRSAHQIFLSPQPYRIITDNTSRNADRFYIYKTDSK